MSTYSTSGPAYRCRLCGATSYRRLVERGANGQLGYSNRYRCSGCTLSFTDPAQWWGAVPRDSASHQSALSEPQSSSLLAA